MLKLISNRLSDDVLIDRCVRRGDRDAFETVYRRHRDRFYRFLLKLSADPAIAEDVSQQCWLKLLESFASDPIYRPSKHATFSTFLFTLGRNHYIDHYVRRHEAARCDSLDAPTTEGLAAESPTPEAAAHDQQLTHTALTALAQLPLEQREVVSLWSAGFSARAIATMTDAPRNTVLSRKRYGLAQLKRRFGGLGLLASDDGQARKAAVAAPSMRGVKSA